MPFTFDNFLQWPKTIPDATPTQYGVMTPAQVQKLASLTPGGGGTPGFQYAISQPDDGSDFVVNIPVASQQVDGNYVVTPIIQSAVPYNGIIIPFVDQTGTSFRVITDATFDNGILLGFSISHF